MGFLHRLEEQPAVLYADVLAGIIDGLTGKERAIYIEELARHLVALVVRLEDPVALVFGGIATRDDVDQKPTARDAVEGRGHARRDPGGLEARPHRHEKPKSLRQRRQRRGDDPGVLAALAGRKQHSEIAEPVCRLGDLLQVVDVDGASADRGPEIPAVAMRRQEPEDVGSLGRAHDCGLCTASAILIPFGIRPSSKNVSAIFCCLATTSSSIGLMP